MIIEHEEILYNTDRFHKIMVIDTRLWMEKDSGPVSLDFKTEEAASVVYNQIKTACCDAGKFLDIQGT